MPEPAQETCLIAVCEAAEPVVRHHRERYDAAARVGVPAHVTVLYPFARPEHVDEDLCARVRAVAGSVRPFATTFRRTGWFDETVLFLAPEDPSPWLALLAAAAAQFPEHPAYEGRFPDPVPHLTVAHDETRAVLRQVERAVLPRLPVHQQVDALELWTGNRPGDAARGAWRPLETFPLGHGPRCTTSR